MLLKHSRTYAYVIIFLWISVLFVTKLFAENKRFLIPDMYIHEFCVPKSIWNESMLTLAHFSRTFWLTLADLGMLLHTLLTTHARLHCSNHTTEWD